MAPWVESPILDLRLDKSIERRFEHVPDEVFERGRRVLAEVMVIDELASIECPALVVVGSEDAPYLRAAEVLAARLPGAEHHVLEGAAHIVNIEATEAFNALLIDFLGRLSSLD